MERDITLCSGDILLHETLSETIVNITDRTVVQRRVTAAVVQRRVTKSVEAQWAKCQTVCQDMS